MGYFDMCNEKEMSVEGQLKSALRNIEMWDQNPNNNYLISSFVTVQIEDALKALAKGNLFKQPNNGWD